MNGRHGLLIRLLMLLDLAIVAITFVSSAVLTVRSQSNVSLTRFFSMRTRVSNFGIIVLALIICHIVFHVCGLYRSRRLSRRRVEIVDVLQATTLNTACFLALASFFSIRMISIQFLVTFWVLSTVTLLVCRSALRIAGVYMRSRGRDLRYMLVLGSNSRAVDFARMISASPGRGYRILGFVDDDWPGMRALDDTPFRVVSDCAGFAEFLRWNVVDEVAIYLPFASFYKHSCEVVGLCQQHGITMRFNPDIFGLERARWHAEEFDGHHYIATYTGSADLWPRIVKRLIDISVASLALVVFSPVLLCAAIAIKLTSSGPILFNQERIGLNKRRFKIFKFRTMVRDAEKLMAGLESLNEMSGPVFKMRSDPRITAVGCFLRRTSIDELPQLLNVVLGDMSLVGPRPLPVRDYKGFNEDWQRRRFSAKPGITCLWQIGGRNILSFDQWMRLDLQYMDEWSLWLDLKILAKTVPAVLRGTGAT